jgi:hypothetical protein
VQAHGESDQAIRAAYTGFKRAFVRYPLARRAGLLL